MFLMQTSFTLPKTPLRRTFPTGMEPMGIERHTRSPQGERSARVANGLDKLDSFSDIRTIRGPRSKEFLVFLKRSGIFSFVGGMNPLIQLKSAILPLLITFTLPWFAPMAQARNPHPTPTPTPAPTSTPTPPGEDRGNGNSAAENVQALNLSTNGADNTAQGWFSLFSNTDGYHNTANGYQALYSNTTGVYNTANGSQALFSNTIGNVNTANGFKALYSNTSGLANTASGWSALYSNITGGYNTAVGLDALFYNTGDANTAAGAGVFLSNTTGNNNTASGVNALFSNTIGNFNTANGYQALYNNTAGSNNVALGVNAGNGVTTANNVICIGTNVLGADVSNTAWIGNVYGNATLNGQAAPVVVSVDGQLATNVSSQRFKKDIATMEKASEAILSLRPVTFHYKTDAKGFPQFGLIAEEVAKVNPALVLPDKEGKPYTVRYDAVNAMLLNEFLKEHRKNEEQQKQINVLTAQLKEQAAQIQKVSAHLEAGKPAPRVVNNP